MLECPFDAIQSTRLLRAIARHDFLQAESDHHRQVDARELLRPRQERVSSRATLCGVPPYMSVRISRPPSRGSTAGRLHGPVCSASSKPMSQSRLRAAIGVRLAAVDRRRRSGETRVARGPCVSTSTPTMMGSSYPVGTCPPQRWRNRSASSGFCSPMRQATYRCRDAAGWGPSQAASNRSAQRLGDGH